MSNEAKCEICGEPMPAGETRFKFHGYSGPCPKPPLLQPYQQRVVAEKSALDKKATDLSNFIGTSPVFETLDAAAWVSCRFVPFDEQLSDTTRVRHTLRLLFCIVDATVV